jgi:tripeptidyl-peptidase I
LPAYYQKRQCNEFLKLGLQGVSVFYASGDDGVAGYQGGDSANGCLGPNSTIFNPAWPNTCPYITNVGATKVYPGHTVYEPESAVVDPKGQPYRSAFSSGGGFSNIYPVPDYQAEAVAEYFEKHNPPYPYYTAQMDGSIPLTGGLYNRIGRGYPDVAANGDNIATYVGGKARLEGGTSASTPIFAAIVNRINEERIAKGKNTVGFINPTLYKHPHVLNDIKNGTNPGCGTVGFAAVKGWDPVTGLGTPNYPKMLDLFLELP